MIGLYKLMQNNWGWVYLNIDTLLICCIFVLCWQNLLSDIGGILIFWPNLSRRFACLDWQVCTSIQYKYFNKMFWEETRTKYVNISTTLLCKVEGSHQKKCHKKWEKSTIFLIPPPSPRMIWTFWIWEKLEFWWPPPLT